MFIPHEQYGGFVASSPRSNEQAFFARSVRYWQMQNAASGLAANEVVASALTACLICPHLIISASVLVRSLVH